MQHTEQLQHNWYSLKGRSNGTQKCKPSSISAEDIMDLLLIYQVRKE